MGAVVAYLIQMALPAVAGAGIWALTKPLRRRPAGEGGTYRERVLLALFMFVAGLLAITLTPIGFWNAVFQGRRPIFPPPFQGEVNLVPFLRSWKLLRFYYAHGLWESILINFPGNVLIFLPVGLFAGLLSDKPRWYKGALWALGVSLFIEMFQLVVSRGTDVDDLILNTLGGLLGHGAFLLLCRTYPNFVRQCAKEKSDV